MAFQTNFQTTVSQKFNIGDTSLYLSTLPTVYPGRLALVSNTIIEWIDYTALGSGCVTGVTRQLSLTADPATSTGSGYAWGAGTKVIMVAMHDQIADKSRPFPIKSYTTVQRDALTNISNYSIIYNTTDGQYQYYNGSAWASFATGTVADASTTVAGKVEIATTAESIAGTDTGGSGAKLVALPSDIAKNTQSGTFLYGEDSGGDDTYVVALTPVLASYTTGQRLRAKLTTANTGACTIDFGPGAKNIKMVDGTDPLDGDIQAGGIYDFIYDGTNMVLQRITPPTTPSNVVVLPLGESFTGATTPQAAVIINDLFQAECDNMSDVGRSGANVQRLAIKISPQAAVTVASINVGLCLNSAAQDGLRFKIETDTAGSPSGSVVTNGTSDTVSSSDLSSSDKVIKNFAFSTPPTLTANTSYWFILEKTGSLQATNYDRVQVSGGGNYASFIGKSYNGSAWVSASIMNLEIIPSTQGSQSLWLADANHTVATMRQFNGLCVTTGSAGTSATIYTQGNVPGFSGLSPNTPYYLDTTAGAISKTGIGIFVGDSVSATQINIPANKKMADSSETIGVAAITGMLKSKVKAPSDGFLMVYNSNDATAVTGGVIEVFNGITEDEKRTYYYDELTNGQRTTVCIPIRKGQYWEINTVGSGALTVGFTPLI